MSYVTAKIEVSIGPAVANISPFLPLKPRASNIKRCSDRAEWLVKSWFARKFGEKGKKLHFWFDDVDHATGIGRDWYICAMPDHALQSSILWLDSYLSANDSRKYLFPGSWRSFSTREECKSIGEGEKVKWKQLFKDQHTTFNTTLFPTYIYAAPGRLHSMKKIVLPLFRQSCDRQLHPCTRFANWS